MRKNIETNYQSNDDSNEIKNSTLKSVLDGYKNKTKDTLDLSTYIQEGIEGVQKQSKIERELLNSQEIDELRYTELSNIFNKRLDNNAEEIREPLSIASVLDFAEDEIWAA